MKNLIYKAAGKIVDRGLLLWRENAKLGAKALNLSLTNLLYAILQCDDRGHCIEAQHAAVKARDLLLDQHLSPLRFSSAIAYVGFYHLLEVIDVVDENSVYVAHLWSHVPRHSDVDEEHRPILASVHEQLAM